MTTLTVRPGTIRRVCGGAPTVYGFCTQDGTAHYFRLDHGRFHVAPVGGAALFAGRAADEGASVCSVAQAAELVRSVGVRVEVVDGGLPVSLGAVEAVVGGGVEARAGA